MGGTPAAAGPDVAVTAAASTDGTGAAVLALGTSVARASVVAATSPAGVSARAEPVAGAIGVAGGRHGSVDIGMVL